MQKYKIVMLLSVFCFFILSCQTQRSPGRKEDFVAQTQKQIQAEKNISFSKEFKAFKAALAEYKKTKDYLTPLRDEDKI